MKPEVSLCDVMTRHLHATSVPREVYYQQPVVVGWDAPPGSEELFGLVDAKVREARDEMARELAAMGLSISGGVLSALPFRDVEVAGEKQYVAYLRWEGSFDLTQRGI